MQGRNNSRCREGADVYSHQQYYTREEEEFIQAIRSYQKKAGKKFLAWSEVLGVVKSLGYERRDPARETHGQLETRPLLPPPPDYRHLRSALGGWFAPSLGATCGACKKRGRDESAEYALILERRCRGKDRPFRHNLCGWHARKRPEWALFSGLSKEGGGNAVAGDEQGQEQGDADRVSDLPVPRRGVLDGGVPELRGEAVHQPEPPQAPGGGVPGGGEGAPLRRQEGWPEGR